MFPKPKSAPPRVNSKFVSSRTNAMKEIEAWVKKDSDPWAGNFEASSRMSGQLTDNITEERMLKAKLWELSKERYKFIAQNTFEKKTFLDRISRKSPAIRRIMSATDDGGIRRHSMARSSNNARYAFLERMDTIKRHHKHKDKYTEDDAFITAVPLRKSSHSSISSETSVPVPVPELDLSAIRSHEKLPKIADIAHGKTSVQTIINIEDQAHALRNGYRRKVKRANIQEDPRYFELHHKLCPVINKSPKIDIYSVVTKIESLHVQPKLPTDSKLKIDKKALAYMKKKGFMFP